MQQQQQGANPNPGGGPTPAHRPGGAVSPAAGSGAGAGGVTAAQQQQQQQQQRQQQQQAQGQGQPASLRPGQAQPQGPNGQPGSSAIGLGGGAAGRPSPYASTNLGGAGARPGMASTSSASSANPSSTIPSRPGMMNNNNNPGQTPMTSAAAAGNAAAAAAAAQKARQQQATNASSSTPSSSGAPTTTTANANNSSSAASGGQATTTAGGATIRPLNVKDALAYLDQVKSKFRDQPETYNSFLDIMKDFKTQVIDTPGVIDRVSSLFRHHPTLINNFNLFLPDGYSIETQSDPRNRDNIYSYRVITPQGVVQVLDAGQATSLTNVNLPGQARKPAPVGGPGSAAAAATTGTPGTQPGATASAAQQHQQGARPGVSTAGTGQGPMGGIVKKEDPYAADLNTRRAAEASRPGLPGAAGSSQSGTSNPSLNRIGGPESAMSATAQRAAPTAAGTLPGRGPGIGGAGNALPPGGNLSAPASQANSAQPSRTATPGAASALSNSASTDARRPPIEFNHAISYVNKIKTRFISQPEVYKTFLDILQTYQKEQRPIQHVYAQVTKLFGNAPDLLEEFKQFLPDHSAQQEAAAAQNRAKAAATAPAQAAVAVPPGAAVSGAKPAGAPATSASRPIPAAEDVSSSSAAAAQKRKRATEKVVDVGAVAAPGVAGAAGGQLGSAGGKGGKQQPGRKVGKGAAAGVKDPPTVAQQSSSRFDGSAASMPSYPQPILSYLPPGYTLPGAGGSGAVSQGPPPTSQMTNEERLFFDRVADFIDDKFTYYEFLKLLNLFTQDIIDLPTLVSRAWLFIGSAPDLWLDFRHLVGWQDGSSVNGRTIENGEWIVENIPAIERKGPDLSKADSAGPSYRKLPTTEINMQCSGRDKLCWEVLNDEWVSVMSLGSEEVFLAHRKNPFEEALHRSEEERHEYDFHIEANMRTIALLEPIAGKIASMTPKERESFKLRPGLGGQSKSLYQRIIKKVYGKEIGREVIAALHENPCVSVPIVLARLKQKDEEWKRALREWNRVWREVDAKNFYRSLDHQGITFKAQDKRYINPKSLVTEIETLRRTEMQKQIAAPLPYRPPAATYQLAYPISDETVLFDSLKLFLSYLDRAPGYHTLAERDRIEAFLRSLTSLVFAIPVSVLDAMLTPVQDDEGSGLVSEDEMSDSAASSVDGHGPSSNANGKRSGSVTGGASGRKNGDLRKKAIKNAGQGEGSASKKARGGLEGEMTPASSRDSTPVPVVKEDVAMDGQASTTADAENIVEKEANGESTFKRDVPASAAGLDSMAGVETTRPEVQPVSQSIDSIALAQQPRHPSSQPVIPADAPPETMQLASDVVENGPIVPSLPTPPGTGDSADSPTQGQTTPVLHNAQRDGQHQIRRFNFFCNTPYYCAIRLLQLLYSRLHIMKEATKALGSTTSDNALKNTSYTTMAKANPRFAGQEAPSPSFLYDSMLELCEKLFGSEIDQPTFEDGVRALFGNKAYHIFTIDKLLSSLVKTVWSLIDSNRETYAANGEIFKLLVDDRRYPTTAQAQQISYRTMAELAAGSEEHLYRIEWLPRRHSLTFQLLGKDEILPEDEGDLSKAWERYIETFIGDPVTKGLALSEKEIEASIAVPRNLRIAKNSSEANEQQVLAKSELESRICMRSYRLFWQGSTEDAMHRAWPTEPDAEKLKEVSDKRKKRFDSWIEQRRSTLDEQAADKAKKEAETVAAQTLNEKDKDAAAATTTKSPSPPAAAKAGLGQASSKEEDDAAQASKDAATAAQASKAAETSDATTSVAKDNAPGESQPSSVKKEGAEVAGDSTTASSKTAAESAATETKAASGDAQMEGA